MSYDTDIRNLERDAVVGDLNAGARLLAISARSTSSLMVTCSNCEGNGLGGKILNSYDNTWTGKHRDCGPCRGIGSVEWGWQERFTLAAYCGHAASRVLMGPCSCCSLAWAFCDVDFKSWVHGLSRWPGEILMRAASAAVKAWLVVWEHEHANPDDWELRHLPTRCCIVPRLVLDVVDAWIVDPTEVNRKACSLVGGDYDPSRLLAKYAGSIGKPVSWLRLRVITEAILLTNKKLVHDAIRTSLIEWAL